MSSLLYVRFAGWPFHTEGSDTCTDRGCEIPDVNITTVCVYACVCARVCALVCICVHMCAHVCVPMAHPRTRPIGLLLVLNQKVVSALPVYIVYMSLVRSRVSLPGTLLALLRQCIPCNACSLVEVLLPTQLLPAVLRAATASPT